MHRFGAQQAFRKAQISSFSVPNLCCSLGQEHPSPLTARLAGKWISIKWTPFSCSLLLASEGYVLTGEHTGTDPWTYWVWWHTPSNQAHSRGPCGSFVVVVVQNLLDPFVDHGHFSHYRAVLTTNSCYHSVQPSLICRGHKSMQYRFLAEGGSVHIEKIMWACFLELCKYWPFSGLAQGHTAGKTKLTTNVLKLNHELHSSTSKNSSDFWFYIKFPTKETLKQWESSWKLFFFFGGGGAG